MRVSGVLLAAGASTRFGSSKMLAPVPPEGRPMLAHVIDTWRRAGFAEIVVVLGSGAAELRGTVEERFLGVKDGTGGGGTSARPFGTDGRGPARPLDASAPPPVRFVENAEWESGMFSSVTCGLTALRESPSTHVAISPADLPFLNTFSLRRVLEAVRSPLADSRTLLVPVCGRRRGHPLVIPVALAARVRAWPADARLSRLFAEPDVMVLHLEGFDETILADVDRPVDLEAAGGARLP